MIDTMAVSFVVIAYNEERGIERCLRSIAAQDGVADWELVVVDDGSTDATAAVVEAAAAWLPQLRLIRLGTNQGRGAARQAGVRAARGDALAFVDADIVLPSHWLRLCADALRGADAAGGVAVPDGDVGYVFSRFRLTPKIAAATTTVTGNNGLYRRTVFESVSFDASLREGEDVALMHAMDGNGIRSVTLSGLVVHHEESKPFGEALRWLFDSGRGASRQLVRYRRVRIPDLLAGTTVIVVIGALVVALLGRPLALLAVPTWLLTVSTVHLSRKFRPKRHELHRWPAAVVVHAGLLGAYFAGRFVGIGPAIAGRRDAGATDPDLARL